MALQLSTGLRNALTKGKGLVFQYIGTGFGLADGGGSNDTLTRSSGSFVTDAIAVGDFVYVQGTTTSANNKWYRVKVVNAASLEVATGTVNTAETMPAGGSFTVIRPGSMYDIFREGRLDIYSGTQPANADTTESGTLLVSITVGSGSFTAGNMDTAGLNFDPATATAGMVSKVSGDTWSGVAGNTGTAGWFRFYDNAVTTGTSSTGIRFDGSCGTSGAQLNMSSTSITTSATVTIDAFDITLPAS